MANILIEIQASVQDFSRKLRSIKTEISKFVSDQKILAKGMDAVSKADKDLLNTFNQLENKYKSLTTASKAFTSEQRSMAATFLRLKPATKGAVSAMDTLQRKMAAGDKINAGWAKSVQTRYDALGQSTVQAVRYINGLDTATRNSLLTFMGADKNVRNLITSVANMSPVTKQAAGGANALGRAWTSISNVFRGVNREGEGFVSRLRNVGRSVVNFNLASRALTGSARAIGTSMIFAGGAFRELGVGINVTASLLQAFIPAIGNLLSGLAQLGPIGYAIGAALVSVVGNLAAMGATAVVAGIALGKLIKDGVAFNASMEENTVTVATLILQYKDLVDAQGNVLGEQSKYTEAQFRNLSVEKQQEEISRRRLATTTMFRTAISLAEKSVVQLTVAAADSIYTTKDLLGAFQATYSVLGKYGVASDQAARLTGQFARVASVAGVSAANLASQLTLWLTGAGRITSPLARFATGIGLGRDRMKELNAELKRFKDNPVETNRIIGNITNLLTVFNVGGRLMSDTWVGIMSNMQESFALFAGVVTKGFFELVRNAVFNFNELEKGADRATGALSKIFKIDPETGTFFTNVTRIVDVFQEPFQEAAAVLQRLISAIGTDIASAINYLTNLLISLAQWIGKNEITVLAIYDTAKQLLATTGELLFALMAIFGVTRDVDGNMKNIHSTVSFLNTVLAHAVWFVEKLEIVLRLAGIGAAAIGGVLAAFPDILKYVLDTLTNIVIAVVNFHARLMGVQKQLDYIVPQLKLISWFFGKADDQSASLTRRMEDMKKVGDLIVDTEKQRLKLLQDQTAQYEIQTQVAKLLAYEASNPNSDLNKSLPRGKTGETIRETEDRQREIEKRIRSLITDISEQQIDSYLQKRIDGRMAAMREINPELSESEIRARSTAEVLRDHFAYTQKLATERAKNNTEEQKDGEKQTRIRRQVLDTLFNVRKEYAELELELVRQTADQAIQAVRDNLDIERELLRDKLEEQEISIEDYYENLQRLRRADFNNELQSKQNELALLQERHRITMTTLAQEDLRAQANYEASERSAYDKAKLDLELAENNVRRETATLNLLKEEKALQEAIASIRKKDLVESLRLLNEQRQAIRAFFTSLRELRLELDNAIGDPYDSGAVIRAQEAINRKYAERIKLIREQKWLSDEEREDALDALYQMNAIETQLIETAQLRARFEREDYVRSRGLSALESDRARGLITEIKYRERILELNKANADALSEYAKILEERRRKAFEAGADSEAQRLKEEYDNIQDRIRELRTVTEDVLLDMNRGFRSAFKDFFVDMQNDITNIGDAFLNLGKKIQAAFQNALADRLIQQFLGPLLGEEGQTSGQAGGVFASFARMMGLDRNSKAAAENDKTLASAERIGETFVVSLDASKKALDATIVKMQAETEKINQFIQDAVIEIKGATTLNIDGTKANFTGVGKLDTHKLQVFETEKGGMVVGSVNGKQLKLDNSSDFNKKRDYGRHAADDIPAPVGSIITALFDGILKTGSTRLGGNFVSLTSLDGKVQVIDRHLAGLPKEIAELLKTQTEITVAKGTPIGLVGTTGRSTGPHTHHEFKLRNERTGLFEKQDRHKYLNSSDDTLRNAAQHPVIFDKNSRYTVGVSQNDSQPVKAEITKIDPAASKDLTENAQTTEAIVTGFQEQKPIFENIGTGITGVNERLNAGLYSELSTFASRLEAFLTSNVVAPIVAATEKVFSLSANNVKAAAYGGYISGPGGPTDDKIPAWLSNGEFVIRAKAVKALGLDRLHQLNNADKLMPKFGFGGFLGSIFGSIGKFLVSDTGKMLLGTAIPMVAQRLLGEKGAAAMALSLPLIFGGLVKANKAEKVSEETVKLLDSYNLRGNPFSSIKPSNGTAWNSTGFSLPRFAKGGLAGAIPRFAGGGGWGMTLGSPILKAPTGGGGKSAAGSALKGGLAMAAIQIGFALLGRLFAKKQPKSDPNRTADPYGLNPETLTFYKKPIISGSRNYLAGGGLVSNSMLLDSMPGRNVGLAGLNLDDLLQEVGMGGSEPININQNINISTPDVHSFRNSKGQVERDLARMTQRGLKRRAPKY